MKSVFSKEEDCIFSSLSIGYPLHDLAQGRRITPLLNLRSIPPEVWRSRMIMVDYAFNTLDEVPGRHKRVPTRNHAEGVRERKLQPLRQSRYLVQVY